MGEPYSATTLAELTAILRTTIRDLRGLIYRGTLDASDVRAMAQTVIDTTKEWGTLGAELQALVKPMHRRARIILTLTDLGQSTGAPVDPAVFIAKCRAEDLDYLVALKQSKRDPADSVEFYLKCRETALGLGEDVGEEPYPETDTPGGLDPPQPVDYR